MALANFFDKAALSAAQILQQFNHKAFSERLVQQVVGIEIDDAAARSESGKLLLELLGNMLARLYPRIALIGDGEQSQASLVTVSDLCRKINPDIELLSSGTDVTFALHIGPHRSRLKCEAFYLGADGWLAYAGRSPKPIVDTNNVLGVATAACLGAANVFRWVFKDQLHRANLDEELCLSLFELGTNPTSSHNPPVTSLHFEETFLVGLGAIGNATTWVLSHMPEISGCLHLIDAEAVDLSNLQRYVLTDQSTIDVAKVDLAKKWLKRASLEVIPHQETWADFLDKRDNWDLGRVAVAVDSAQDRMAVQASLPRLIFNSWTQPENLGVSRHAFLEGRACLACLYLPKGKRKDESEIVRESLGLADEDALHIRNLLQTGNAVGEEFVLKVATARQLPAEELLRFADKPLRLFYESAVCGGLFLRLGNEHGNGQTEVPLVFQSVLAGVLLARELIFHSMRGDFDVQATITRFNLLRPLTPHINSWEGKDPTGRCICHDADFKECFTTKYGESPAHAGA